MLFGIIGPRLQRKLHRKYRNAKRTFRHGLRRTERSVRNIAWQDVMIVAGAAVATAGVASFATGYGSEKGRLAARGIPMVDINASMGQTGRARQAA